MKTKTNNTNNINGKLITFTLIGAFLSAPSIAMAQDNDQDNYPSRERILNHFDKNGDGKLNDREKYHARKAIARWKNAHDGSVDRPDVRPDRVRPNVRPDRVRPDVRPDRARDLRTRPVQRNRQPVRRPR